MCVQNSAKKLMILDGGPCTVGIESTIVDVSDGHARVLRPGMLSASAIAECIGAALGNHGATTPRVPGTLAQHYAPATPLTLLNAAELVMRARALGQAGQRLAVVATPATLREFAAVNGLITTRSAATNPGDYARELYATLRELDNGAADQILIEIPPLASDWDAIHDRLTRAAAGAGCRADPP